ncbi:MAG TPA: PAS domain S-box protein [Allosphingosinicella sp.]|nr:PAS domain S-box protein [Allosphingosinicella sp.]
MLASADLEPIKAAAISSSLDGLIVIDERGLLIGLNPAAEALFGFARGEAVGQPIVDLIIPEHLREAHSRGFAAYLAGGPPKVVGKRIETQALHKDGRLIPIELTILEIRVGEKRVFTANVRDRSENAATQEQLQQAQRQLELAVAGAGLGVWSFNPHTGVSWYSDRVREIVGIEENFLADGEAFRERVHPDDRSQLVFDRFDDFPEGPVAREYRIIRPDGETRWISSLGAAERDGAGQVRAVHGIIIDITERRQADEELALVRRDLELAVEGAQLGVWSYDPKTGSCWFSDRAKALLELEDNVLADARDLRNKVHPDDWGRLADPYINPYPHEPLPIEYRVIKPDGSIRWVYGLGAAIRDEQGVTQTVHGILADITNRKLADEALEDSRQRLELAVEGAKLGTWTYCMRTGATWYSSRSKQMYGLPADTEMTTEVIQKSIHPDHWEEVSRPYLTGFIEDKVEVEYRVVCPDGSTRWIYSLGASERDSEGRATNVNGIHLDITARKQAEVELAETRRQLELAIEGAKLGSWTVDPETGATWYSDRSRALHGLDKELRLDARMLKSYIHPDDWDLVLDSYRRGFPGDSIALEHRVVWPNGDIRWVQSIGTALRDETGKVHTVSGIHLDITDRKRAEAELERSRDALVQSEKLAALGALLAGVSHELNNPLAAIVGQAEMLAEDAQGSEFEARARRIGAAAERCALIVQTFLAMARQRERQPVMLNMNDIIASALELTDYTLRTAGVAVRVNFGSALPPIEGDRDQLHQVLVNLIVNAQQAMEKGEAFEKTLTIRTSVNQAGRVLVDVSDTGPGIPETVRHRIFEPFFTTKRQSSGGGTGIGLSFSQGIIEAHGGMIRVEPSRRGAHFRIELPAAAGEALIVAPREQIAIIPDVVPARRRCLIVEDEPDVADTLRELVEREGFDVTVAADGAEALFILDRGEFDILLSDLRMPSLNGPELYARLIETKPDLVRHMGFVTGDTMGDSMGEFARASNRPVLEKPFTKAGIRAMLASLADHGE